MAKRKRKHGRAGAPQRPHAAAPAPASPTPPRGAHRSDRPSGAPSPAAKARPAAKAKAPASRSDGKAMMARGYARAEERNQKLREELETLDPGERPRIVVWATLWMGVLALGLLYTALFSGQLTGPIRVRNAILVVLLIVAGLGTFQLRYWAILGTQTFLGLSLVVGLLALLFVSPLLAVLVLIQSFISGYIFFRLIKVMARLQKTARQGRNGR